jgi:hypothetical protein
MKVTTCCCGKVDVFTHFGKMAERGKSYEIQTVDRVTSPHCGVKKLKKRIITHNECNYLVKKKIM